MRGGRPIVEGMYLLVCIGLVAYTNSGKRANQPQPRCFKVVWVFIGLTALGRLIYDLMG